MTNMENFSSLFFVILLLYGFGVQTSVASTTEATTPETTVNTTSKGSTTSYTCDPDTGGRHQSCVILSDFDDYQYAYCITNNDVLSRTNGTQQCSDNCRSYCFLTCMAEKHGVFKGNVSSDCQCSPTETTDAASQLSSWCLNPQGQANFYDDCIPAQYLSCRNMAEMQSALKKQTNALSSSIDSEENCTAKGWLRDVRKCLQTELISDLIFNTTTCNDVTNVVFADLYRICLDTSYDGVVFCGLPSIFRNSFNREFIPLIPSYIQVQINDVINSLKNC